MAAPSKPVGYECEFVDQVPEDFFCKQCSHVAREPHITTCCGECFCKACVEVRIQEKKSCPSCQEENFSSFLQRKYRTKILALKVYCLLKERGCEWTGQLQQLDDHTSEVCRFYPVVCPNRCGASIERDALEDHMTNCDQQKVQCEFSYAGCEAEFIRDHQQEHLEQNTQQHLTLLAAATSRISQTFEAKLQEQQKAFEKKLEDKDSEIKAIVNNEASQLIHEQQQIFEQSLDEKDRQTKKALEEQKKMFEERLGEQQKELHRQLEDKVQQVIRALEDQHAMNSLRMEHGILPYEFTMDKYRETKAKKESYYTLFMYTHPRGYKIRLRFNPNGDSDGRGTHVSMTLCMHKGNYDDKLKFPARFIVTLVLLNQHRDQDHYARDIKCYQKEKIEGGLVCAECTKFIPIADLEWNDIKRTQYLTNDCLKFRITKIPFSTTEVV